MLIPRNPLVELVGYLREQDIIPLKLAELIFIKNDINAADEDGNTALFFAINKNDLFAIQKLLSAGAKNTLNNLGRTPFLHAIEFAHFEIIEFFLDSRNLPVSFLHDVLATDCLNRNALHIAAAATDFDATQILLSDPRFANSKNKKDLYGHTPFDLAIFGRQCDIAEALSKQPKTKILKNPHYGKPPLDLSQNKVNDQLLKYLLLSGRQGDLILEDGGNCSGWVFLFFLYASLEESEKFNDILTAITSWDGTQEGMLNNILTSSLKREFPFSSVQALFNFYTNKEGPFKALWKKGKNHPELITFFKQFKSPKNLMNFLLVQHRLKTPLYKALCLDVFEKYNSMADLLEEITNHLCLFQFSTQAVRNLQLPGWDQDWRIQQYQLMQSAHSNRKLNLIFNFKELTLNQAQLAEYLAFFAKRPNSFIDIGGADHATGLYITPEGKYYYFDPNFKHKVIPFDSPEALAKHMFKFMFSDEGNVKDGKIIISFDGYQFVEQNALLKAAVIPEFPLVENGFTPLHQAIMRHDVKLVYALLQADPEILYATDSHGHTPFRMAIRMQNGKCLSIITSAVKNAKCDLNRVIGKINFEELRSLHSSYIQHLLANNILTPECTDEGERTLLHCAIGYQSRLIAKKVMTHPQWDVNKKDVRGVTPLMNAVNYNQEMMLLFLDDSNIDVNITDNDGMTALMHALWKSSPYTNALLLKLKNKRSLRFDPNIADESGKTAIFYAIIYHADPSTLRYLLNAGAKANLVDTEDNTLLVYAFKHHINLPLMKTLLLFQGLDVNKPNKAGLTPLMQGILFKSKIELLSLLLKDNRIQVNDTDQEGLTALMHALKNKADKQFILQLIDHPKLNTHIKDKTGKSALEYAKEHYPDKEIIHAIQARKTEQPLHILPHSIEYLFSTMSIRKGFRATSQAFTRLHSNKWKI